MTVSYNLDVSTSTTFTFFRLLIRWRGSVWKSVLLELAIWTFCYLLISFVYRTDLLFTNSQKIAFENFAALCDTKLDYIPLTFMLGFFITIIVKRWGDIFNNIGLIDNVALLTATYVRGSDEKTRILRRSIVRFIVLAQVLIFRDISMQVRKRFPSIETVVAAGFMLDHEKDRFNELNFKYAKYWMPFQWSFALLYDARQQGKIASDILLGRLIDEVKTFRTGLAQVCNHDWVPIPLVYPQVVFLAVHAYFVICLVSRQYIMRHDAPNRSHFDLVIPIMTMLQFVFYVGWMKVAEALLNPLGEDDDDFECNFLIDRNLAIGLMVVDEAYNRPPAPAKDIFWEDSNVEPLYSSDAASRAVHPLIGSTANVILPDEHAEVIMVSLSDRPGSPSGRRVSVISTGRHQLLCPEQGRNSLIERLKRRFSRSKVHNLTNVTSGTGEAKDSIGTKSGVFVDTTIDHGTSNTHYVLTPTPSVISIIEELAKTNNASIEHNDVFVDNHHQRESMTPTHRNASIIDQSTTDHRSEPLTSLQEEDGKNRRSSAINSDNSTFVMKL